MWPIVVSPASVSIWKGVTGEGRPSSPPRCPDADSPANFQVIDRFPVTLEPEMTRLDDARVDGADGDFVDLFAVNAEEVNLSGPVGPGRFASGLLSGETDRLEPGMAIGNGSRLLVYLPLEKVHLGKAGRE